MNFYSPWIAWFLTYLKLSRKWYELLCLSHYQYRFFSYLKNWVPEKISYQLFLIDSKVLMVDLSVDLLFSIALRSRLWVDVPCSLDRVQSSWLKEIHTTLRIVLLKLKVPKGFSDLRESWQNLFVWHHVQFSVMIPRIFCWSPVTYSRLRLSGSTELILVTF